MAETLSTDVVGPRRALAYWTDLICSVYVGLDCEAQQRGGFRSKLSRYPLPTVRLTKVSGSPQHVKRSTPRLAQMPSDDFLINLQLAGRSKVVQDGRVAEIGPGDLAMYDASRPYSLIMDEDFRMIVFQLPRAILRERLVAPERLTAMQMPGDRGFGQAASGFLRTMPEAAESGDLPPALIERHMLDILATLLGRATGADVLSDRQSARLLAAKAVIENRLDDPDLDREEIAAEAGLSVRGLSRVFALEDDTPTAYVRRRRLERCKVDLLAPQLAGRTITEIALSHGFNDTAHFSRLFRDAYGASPAEFRARNGKMS